MADAILWLKSWQMAQAWLILVLVIVNLVVIQYEEIALQDSGYSCQQVGVYAFPLEYLVHVCSLAA